MTNTPDRHEIHTLVSEARAAGARKEQACEVLGLSARTLQRWTQSGEVAADDRPLATRPTPANKLSEAERVRILEVAHDAEFESLPPSQIVPRLADRGEYIASEATIYRTLHAEDEQKHRGRAHAPHPRKAPTSYCATGPNQVWTWDITWLAGPIRGQFFYLYLILDIYSRKVVGWEVHTKELGEYASALVRRAVMAEGCIGQPLVLHADNGSIMKGATLKATLEFLGIISSFSRPRVSDDNPFSEAIFRTCKYRPNYPVNGFATLEEAREWVFRFVAWYNGEHRHSGIRFVTPLERHLGRDEATLANRQQVYAAAKARNPERWSGDTRDWSMTKEVWLNPENQAAEMPRNVEVAA
jgi:putative transposase